MVKIDLMVLRVPGIGPGSLLKKLLLCSDPVGGSWLNELVQAASWAKADLQQD